MSEQLASLPQSLIDLIRRGNDEAPALDAPGGDPLRFSDLLAQVDYVGGILRSVGVAKDDTVVVILPNGPTLASAFLGVASFAACAPLNHQFGRDDIEFYISDLKPAAIILPADEDSPARGIARDSHTIVLDLEVSSAARAGEFRFRGFASHNGAADDHARNDDVALILHTSGTTARPKMVPLSHRNLCASAAAVASTLALTRSDRSLNMMPLFHIHGLVGVLLSSIHAGASVICTMGFDGEQFPRWLTECRPTWYSAVPTIHQSALAVTHELRAGGNHCLRLIRSSSAALPPPVLSRLESTFGVPVIEAYGMTEAAHQMASNPLPPATRKPGSVGPPAGPDVSVMNADGDLLLAGETGEIVIRGPNVTSGYLGQPEANAAAFTNGWFRTGDLGYIDSDGYLFINGRKKEIINRGGEKISPREIDEVLLSHDAVEQAVAFAVPHPTLGEDLAAAVVFRPNCGASENDLQSFARERLAPFKVPSRIVFVTSIPKGPTGKLQRIGLHEKLREQLPRECVAPRTELEEILLDLWREVLPVDQIGVQDNFFGCGGDSLAAVRLVTRINSRFELDLAVTSVFQAPSIEAQAVLVERALLDQLQHE